MATSSSKHLLPTQAPSSVFLAIFCLFLLLLNKVNSSDSLSFSFTKFGADVSDIIFQGDAVQSEGTLQLTKTDESGNPVGDSVGGALYIAQLHLWERSSGRLASFYSSFSFVITYDGEKNKGDGLTFFIVPQDFIIPSGGTGGLLGLFKSEDDALNTTLNQVVAVEFDTFNNQWDPYYGISYQPHIGVDVNSIKSAKTVKWQLDDVPSGSVANAQITYDSVSKTLKASLTYPNVAQSGDDALSHVIDLRSVLPEWVRIGFSASTGEGGETHNVVSWTFTSNLENSSASGKKSIAHSAI